MDHLLLAETGHLFAAAHLLIQHVIVGEGLVHQDVYERVLGLLDVFLRGLDAFPAGPQADLQWEPSPGLLALLRLCPRTHDLTDRWHSSDALAVLRLRIV